MNKIIYILAIVMLFSGNVCSAEEKTAEPENNDKPAQLPDHMLRDPFWPIGWQPKGFGTDPKDTKKLEKLKKWELAIKEIEITGISRGPKGNYFALIKDHGVVEKGDMLSVDYGGLTYTWLIKDVTKRGIKPVKVRVGPAR